MSFMDDNSYLVSNLVTAAVLYLSPYNTSVVMAALHGGAAQYFTRTLMSGDSSINCAVYSAIGAGAGFMFGPNIGLDPVVASAIGAPVVTIGIKSYMNY